MKILITSGGTTEKLDSVRGVTNFSTGGLGATIATAFAATYNSRDRRDTCEITYIHGLNAVVPRIPFLTPFPVESTADLLKEVTFALTHTRPTVDVIIHAMAVSDYTISEVRDSGGCPLNRRGKISSDEPCLNVKFTPTPKVIAQLRRYAPYAAIVGFKLLDGVTDDVLIRAGEKLRVKNDCDFVLANDVQRIGSPRGDSKHYGVLLGRNGVVGTYSTKQEIAGGIVKAVTEQFLDR